MATKGSVDPLSAIRKSRHPNPLNSLDASSMSSNALPGALINTME